MHWLALQWLPPDLAQARPRTPSAASTPPAPAKADADALPALSAEARAWWALRFTPHVAWVDEALLLEVSACERLWGGRRALLRQVWTSQPGDGARDGLLLGAQGATSLVALARLRLKVPAASAGASLSSAATAPERAADLPLRTLSAARPHLAALGHLGCRRWGDLAALPRAGLARRFGPALVNALDVAFGRLADAYAWITPPDTFEQTLELPERADTAPALLWSARRLLQALQHWLAARHQGVRALELAWRLDQRRLNGQDLPPAQSVVLRTAEPVQAMAHLQRLLAERLARTTMLAPARSLRLRALDTAPWQADTPSFLPEDQPRGDAWHVFVERVSARLGAHNVRMPTPQADHRPECRQQWQPAEQTLRRASASNPRPARAPKATSAPKMNPARHLPDALSPTWLLTPPQPLAMAQDQPLHRGQPLRLISGPQRVEAGWWDAELPPPSQRRSDPATAAHARIEASAASTSAQISKDDRDSATSEAVECDGIEPPPGRPKVASAPDPGETGGPSPARGRGPREAGERGDPISRDYFIAQSATAELLWVYRERPTAASAAPACGGAHSAGQGSAVAAHAPARWFLHGVYA